MQRLLYFYPLIGLLCTVQCISLAEMRTGYPLGAKLTRIILGRVLTFLASQMVTINSVSSSYVY